MSAPENLVGSNQRLVARDQSEILAKAFLAGTVDSAIVHGDIGAGKTFVAIEVARTLFENGYEVFWGRANRFDDEELLMVAQRDAPTLLVFDGYIENREAIEKSLRVRNKNTLVLVCLRTVVLELSRATIVTLFGGEPFLLETRTMNDSELERFDGLLLASGLLGSAATGSVHHRVQRYKSKLSASVFRILVDVVRSEYLKDEIDKEISPIVNDAEVRNAFAAILIGCVLETDFDLDQWDHCVGAIAVNRLHSKYASMSRHFIGSDGFAIVSRPTVVGVELLREYFPSTMVTQGLLSLYKYALGSAFSNGSGRLVETVMRYSRIEPLFGDNGDQKYTNLMAYYNAMQDFQQTDANSQYWLQKAIAASIHGDLARPEVLAKTDSYFATAYARLLPNQNQQRLNIDNYYARYILMHVVNQEDPDKAYQRTSDAILRLMRQIHIDEAKHYPFKAGRTLADIVIKFAPKWAPNLKAKIKSSIERLLEHARSWKRKNGYNFDVESMITDCESVLPLLS